MDNCQGAECAFSYLSNVLWKTHGLWVVGWEAYVFVCAVFIFIHACMPVSINMLWCIVCTRMCVCMHRLAVCVCYNDRAPLRKLEANHINLTNRRGSSKWQPRKGSASRLVLSSSLGMAQETREPLARHQSRRGRGSNAEHVGLQ